MKKIVVILLVMVAFVGCSKDDCEADKKAITEKYALEIEKAGNDQRKILFFQQERDRKLAEACK